MKRVRGCPGCGMFGCWIARRGHEPYGTAGWWATWGVGVAPAAVMITVHPYPLQVARTDCGIVIEWPERFAFVEDGGVAHLACVEDRDDD